MGTSLRGGRQRTDQPPPTSVALDASGSWFGWFENYLFYLVRIIEHDYGFGMWGGKAGCKSVCEAFR